MYQSEIDHKKDNGSGEVRITHLHPELFASLKMSWYYQCVPVPNASDPLSYMVFAKQIQDAALFFGPDSLNVKRLKHRFAALTGNNFDTWFVSEQELEMKRAMAMSTEGGAPVDGAAAPGKIPGKPTGGGPSIASAVSGGNPTQMMGAMMK